jgi:hypothetical protein
MRSLVVEQVAALAIASGNGLLLKGGKEATHSNAVLHKVLCDAVESSTRGRVKRDVVGLVKGRDEIKALLKLHKEIDLVIPRGSNAMVQHIMNSTRIPTLGHADGICHMYVFAIHARTPTHVALCSWAIMGHLQPHSRGSPTICQTREQVCGQRSRSRQGKGAHGRLEDGLPSGLQRH